MTHDPDDDRLEVLADLIRNDPNTWPATDAMSDERMAELTNQAIERGRQRRAARRRRRRTTAVVVGVGVAITGTAVAAAIWSGQPDKPHYGIVCRAEARLDADAIVLPPSDDPAGACQDRWNANDFTRYGITDRPPALAVCIGPNGAIEVFPGTDDTCTQLGLPIADPDLSPENQKLIALQERLFTDIYEIDCLTADEAEATALQILQDLDLDDWTVKVNPDAIGADCAKAGIGEDNRHVFIHEF